MENIIKRYLGQNPETRKQTLIAVITAIIDFLTAFHFIEFSDAQVQAIYKLVLVFATMYAWGYCSHYRNNDYTPEMDAHTQLGRQEKALRDFVGSYVEEPEDADTSDEKPLELADIFESEVGIHGDE